MDVDKARTWADPQTWDGGVMRADDPDPGGPPPPDEGKDGKLVPPDPDDEET